MWISLRQVVEKSEEVARIPGWLQNNLTKMTIWDDSFTQVVCRGKKEFWSKADGREYEKATRILRSSIRLVREAIKALLPEAQHEEAHNLAEEIINKTNILLKFENIVIEYDQSQK